ncbi:PilZ domain-containing protein [Novosphingobium capsulatum]|uniref:PilZ domain-containing protein n=1 Tax=Novosphingobium capsulatum TaxID=13688 RepID=UPI000AE9D1F5|nr:PilZ domain-containing protein [Novosphingobium capsulatum]WQD94215.1 PilZ domain-containing protein [Novosphingobium capsulatum]
MVNAPVTGDSATRGRRADARARLNIPGRLILRRGVCPCLVEDLSRTGARLVLQCPPALGETGVLEINRLEGFGAAVWIRDGHCGFHFDEPLALEQVIALRQFADHFSEHRREQERTAAREFVQGRRFV